MNQTNTHMADIINVTTAASQQTDRWLFIFILLIFGVVIFWSVKWLIAKHEALMCEHRADQLSYTSSLSKIVADVNQTNRELAVVLDRNSAALNSLERR